MYIYIYNIYICVFYKLTRNVMQLKKPGHLQTKPKQPKSNK